MRVAQPLKDGPGTEDVQVAGVRVVLVNILAAGDAEVAPAIFEPSQAKAIPVQGALDATQPWGMTEEVLRAAFGPPAWISTQVDASSVAARDDGRDLILPGLLLRAVRGS